MDGVIKGFVCVLMCLSLLMMRCEGQLVRHDHFLYLDLANESIREEIWQNYKKLSNGTF